MAYRTVHRHHHHFGSDNRLDPVAQVAPGDSLGLEILDASGGRIRADSETGAVLGLDPDFANPVTGPVHIDGAEPGRYSAIPPRTCGGNLDCPDLVAGARLDLPVRVPRALCCKRHLSLAAPFSTPSRCWTNASGQTSTR